MSPALTFPWATSALQAVSAAEPRVQTPFEPELVAQALVEQAVEFYRERFETEGWREHAIYAGIGDTVYFGPEVDDAISPVGSSSATLPR